MAYLGQLFCPADLAVLYPHPVFQLPLWEVVAALLTLAALCGVAWLWRRRCPYLMMGWLWYLGMLLPVIGLVQVGAQAMADRYTYLTLIGPCLALVWGAGLTRLWPGRAWWYGTASALVMAVLMGCAWRQTGYWRDSETLWTHTLACTTENCVAEFNYAAALFDLNRMDEAMDRYRRALKIDPDYRTAQYSPGRVLAHTGRMDEAMDCYRQALDIDPDYLEAHDSLGMALAERGQLDEAIQHFRKITAISPGLARAHYNLGTALERQGQLDEADAEYRKALDADPAYAERTTISARCWRRGGVSTTPSIISEKR